MSLGSNSIGTRTQSIRPQHNLILEHLLFKKYVVSPPIQVANTPKKDRSHPPFAVIKDCKSRCCSDIFTLILYLKK